MSSGSILGITPVYLGVNYEFFFPENIVQPDVFRKKKFVQPRLILNFEKKLVQPDVFEEKKNRCHPGIFQKKVSVILMF